MRKKLILLGFMLAGFTLSSMAQTATPGVTARQGAQKDRIAEGAVSGELTRKEMRELRCQQRRVNKHKQSVKADGIVTKKERAGVRAHQNKANRNIARKKHNARERN